VIRTYRSTNAQAHAGEFQVEPAGGAANVTASYLLAYNSVSVDRLKAGNNVTCRTLVRVRLGSGASLVVGDRREKECLRSNLSTGLLTDLRVP
jgi:hypothetical protein